MAENKRYKIRSILLGVLWSIVGTATIVLLVAAVKKKDHKICKGININIEGVSNHYFIDKKDVEKIISRYAGGKEAGKTVDRFDLGKMETVLKNDIWIKNAEMFFDNNGVLQVDIVEREPVARVFTVSGATFYIDSSLMMLPLSEKFSARLPVFTGFPSEARVLKKRDSLLLKDIKNLSIAIQSDAFLMGMIDQTDITPDRSFEMIPKIGNQLILFGDGTDADEKFRKLKLFYKNIIVKAGWKRYSVINLQYKHQVVGKIRTAEDIKSDSLKTVMLMKFIAARTERLASDSAKSFVQDSENNTTDSSIILRSIQRDEEAGSPTAVSEPLPPVIVEKPVQKPSAAVKPKMLAKPIIKKSPPAKQKDIKKPKVIMVKPTVTDY